MVLGIYIDAFEWVEITNTRGMSQFADGGWIATKPYVSSANYMNKMGDYCQNCSYNEKQKPIQKVVHSMHCIGISLIGTETSYPIILDLVWFIYLR